MKKQIFQERSEASPIIYAYELVGVSTHKGWLKVGYSIRGAQKRIAEQLKTARIKYKIVFEESAMRNDGTAIHDKKDVHPYLRKLGIKNPEGEWFVCTINQLKSAIIAIKSGEKNDDNRTLDFKMRPEQEDAIKKTITYFKSFKSEKGNKNKTPRFLWNAKMRFGKTFASYHLAKKMGWKKILVLTFKPAVQSAWEEDLKLHMDFKGWDFILSDGNSHKIIKKKNPFVCFASFQDFLGRNKVGGIKLKNEWAHNIQWDCVILDEYHFGAWRDAAKELFEAEGEKEIELEMGEGRDYFQEELMPIKTEHYLYLSGTPFRALGSGEFIEEQIYNWTYSDEQKAKEQWKGENNPYSSLPMMTLFTYQLPETIRQIALKGEFNEFDLNIFFSAEGTGLKAKFEHENEVQKWLDLIHGAHMPAGIDDLKLGKGKPALPFSDTRLLNVLSHTFWFLPSVASCQAMKNLLTQAQNNFYHDYEIVVCAGTGAGIGADALPPVHKAMGDPLKTKTITLSCGKLTTGVSVRPWTGILMLRNSSSPETYFQAAFRVQTPWTIKNPDGNSPNEEEIIKKICYVFDFAPDRALKQIATYSCRLNVNESNPEKNVADFISFLPVIAYQDGIMKPISAAGVLEYAMSGTTATLLARRWESALLVNVDNPTLERLMKNKKAMDALMRIEAFRNLNQDIETIINKSGIIQKLKTKANTWDLSEKEKRELTKEEKEFRNKRQEIQDKLKKLATRIPVFMYLTDYRERTLQDVIRQLEPDLFKKVTGLSIKDFDLLISLGVFNESLMNEAVYGFKRYEDKSLSYLDITKHKEDKIGLWSTVISAEEFSAR